ncbi:MAG: hypothetical protein RI955_37 [Bacteroidota bacterium]
MQTKNISCSMKLFRTIFYSFPFQLMLLHFKKHQILMLFWVILFGMITSSIGRRFGLPYLMLDPEYLGSVSVFSFFILGLAAGGFIMIWQITTYVLHAWRFPFLASIREPFIKFCLNNSVLPSAFIILYFIKIYTFQQDTEVGLQIAKFAFIGSFAGGAILISLITFTYFFSTNRNALSMFKNPTSTLGRNVKIKATSINPLFFKDNDSDADQKKIKVDYYFNSPFRIRHTRSVDHYRPELIAAVYKQHYFNMLFIEIGTIGIMLAFSLLMDYPFFRIPAGSSVFLCFSVISILIGAFSYWLRGWRTTMFIFFFVMLNIFSKFDITDTKNKFYGVNYDEKPLPYTAETLSEMADSGHINEARNHTISILNNWKTKFKNDSVNEKPYMILLNVSGGGLRSSYWTFNVLQYLDSLTNGRMMKQTQLITGGSGGMLGASFFRELFLRKQLNSNRINLNAVEWRNAIGKDLLNPVTTSIAVNDLFLPWQSFTYANKSYKKDRGYVFEKQWNENTLELMNKKIMDYYEPEYSSIIPMMILNGTIINDGRLLMMSPQPLNYMVRPNYNEHRISDPKIDAIDFRYFFKTKQADSLKFSSALRVNCTFPYILPNISLPTKPKIDVMDAGIRDNYGFQTSIRFVNGFKEWIKENTAGLIFIQITDFNRSNLNLEDNEETALEQMTNPIGNVFSNLPEFQYFNQNDLLYLMSNSFPTNMYVLRFEYKPANTSERASLSFHLTAKEKQSLRQALYSKQNQRVFSTLNRLVKQQ